MKDQTEQPKNNWTCNECNMPNFTGSVSEEEIEQELHACINCGCFEFHKEPEQNPFTHIVHIGDKGNNKIENLEWAGPVPPTKTHLSERQHQSLVKSIKELLLIMKEEGMSGKSEALLSTITQHTVRE